MSEPISPRTPQQALVALFVHYASKRLLLVGVNRLSAVKTFVYNHPQCQLAYSPTAVLPAELTGQRFDLALFVGCLEHLPQHTGLRLFVGVRNPNASRVAVLVDPEASDWRGTDFFALAMQSNERFQHEGRTLTLYTYDLYEHKQVPDWLSAKLWTNPENFGKYW